MKQVKVLVISDKYDFTTDFISVELEKRNVSYLRLNRDEFHTYQIQIDSINFSITISVGELQYLISEGSLISIYYRAPIFLRETFNEAIGIDEQLYREQWMSFVRNLLIFEKVTWVNNPQMTYKAENKILQLKYAKMIGFEIPYTLITNTPPTSLNKKSYIVKSLDTAFFNVDGKEGFVYANVLSKKEIQNSNLQLAPIIIQDYISHKVDIRVTVVGQDVFATSITINEKGVKNDWRKEKDNVVFKNITIPLEIENQCVKLVECLGLKFGAIDLLMTDEQKYYFLEINPTGEWAWLVHTTNQTIPTSIVNLLVAER